MKVAAADGLSFAVPIDSAAKIIEQFKKNGYVCMLCVQLLMMACEYLALAISLIIHCFSYIDYWSCGCLVGCMWNKKYLCFGVHVTSGDSVQESCSPLAWIENA